MSAPLRRQDRTRGSTPLVDALARAAADGSVTRRGALRGLLAGLATAAAPRRAEAGDAVAVDFVGEGTVSAAATCGGANFNPTTQCCGTAGPTPRTSPYTPTYNGCGGAGGVHLTEAYDLANFTPVCNLHDQCYGTCGSDQGECDRALRDGLLGACRSTYSSSSLAEEVRLFACQKVASSFGALVVKAGKPYHDNGQTEGCKCCVAGAACVNTACCGNTCLGIGQACCGVTAYTPATQQCCNGTPLPGGTPCCPAGTTPCGQNNCCPNGQSCVNGRCVTPPGRIYCSCNDSCYSSVPDCIGHCNANLGCFTGICIPAPAGKCGA